MNISFVKMNRFYLLELYPPTSVAHSISTTPFYNRIPMSAEFETKHSLLASAYVAPSTSSTASSQSFSPTLSSSLRSVTCTFVALFNN